MNPIQEGKSKQQAADPKALTIKCMHETKVLFHFLSTSRGETRKEKEIPCVSQSPNTWMRLRGFSAWGIQTGTFAAL